MLQVSQRPKDKSKVFLEHLGHSTYDSDTLTSKSTSSPQDGHVLSLPILLSYTLV